MKTYPHTPASPTADCVTYHGLTKREYFAAQALIGFVSSRTAITAAINAVEYADTLIQALNSNLGEAR